MKAILEFPERAALVNPASNAAYALDFKSFEPSPQIVEVETGADTRFTVRPLESFALTVKANVCEALLLQTIYFKIASGLTWLLLKDLESARFSLMIDGEIVVPDAALTGHILNGRGEFAGGRLDFSRPSSVLFWANTLADDGAQVGCTFGYFVYNASIVVIKVRDLPAGYGKIQLETGLVAAVYAAKSCSVEKGA